MTQLFSALFFSLATIAASAAIIGMARGEWARLAAILSGRELAGARASAPKVRIKVRAWKGPRQRQPTPLRAAA